MSDDTEQWRDHIAGSVAAFEGSLCHHEFVEAEPHRWEGEFVVPHGSGHVRRETFRVELDEHFPFAPPRVFKIGCTQLTWHMNAGGELCLYRPSEVVGRPWEDFETLATRVYEWHEQANSGWREDFGVPDLNAYFASGDGSLVVSCPRSADLVGRHGHLVQTPGHGWKQIEPIERTGNRPARRRIDRELNKQTYWVLGVDLGVLEQPVWNWPTLCARLTNEAAEQIKTLISPPRRQKGLLVVNYARPTSNGFRPAVCVLLVIPKHDGVTLAGVATVDETDKAMSVRAGRDADWLAGKHVAIVGCGAIGSQLASLLARSGVSEFTLVDPERLEPGNCVRHLADLSRVPARKVDAVADTLVATCGVDRVMITKEAKRIDPLLAFTLIDRCDLVVDATANQSVHELLAHIAEVRRTAVLIVALFRDGDVCQVRRVGYRQNARTEIPRIRDRSSDYRELGCGDPVSPAAPWSATAAAASACRMAIDTMRSRRQRRLPDCITEVFVPQPDQPFDQLGVVECRSI